MFPFDHTDRPISHAELFFDQAKVDARIHEIPIVLPGHGIFRGPIGVPKKPDAVDSLIENNKEVWDAFISHKFPPMLANGSAPLDGFRYFMIQDKLYVETYLRVRMTSVATAESFQTVADFTARSTSTVRYVQAWNEICVKELGVAQDVIDDTSLSPQLQASRDFYTSVARDDNWFMMHVALLPCMVGYYEISKKLLSSPSTARNTVYHPFWTVVNVDSHYVDAYRRFLNDNLEKYWTPEAEKKWNEIFRRACELETAFFDVALAAPDPYHIVDDGVCVIRHFGTGDVLDVYSPNQIDFSQNDTLVVPPLVIDASGKKVKLPDGINTLVTSFESFAKNCLWQICATSQGYTIQNVNTQQYIKFEGDGKRPSLSTFPEYWWINIVPSMLAENKTYQIMAGGHLQFCFDVEGLSLIPGGFADFNINYRKPPPFTPSFTLPLIVGSVVSSNNYQGSSQMWTFEFQ